MVGSRKKERRRLLTVGSQSKDRTRICKHFMEPRSRSNASFPPAFVAWWAGTSNMVVVPARQVWESIPGLLKMFTNTGSGTADSKVRSWEEAEPVCASLRYSCRIIFTFYVSGPVYINHREHFQLHSKQKYAAGFPGRLWVG
jgi:hypothetical protein